jgi:hypothetical protein
MMGWDAARRHRCAKVEVLSPTGGRRVRVVLHNLITRIESYTFAIPVTATMGLVLHYGPPNL